MHTYMKTYLQYMYMTVWIIAPECCSTYMKLLLEKKTGLLFVCVLMVVPVLYVDWGEHTRYHWIL